MKRISQVVFRLTIFCGSFLSMQAQTIPPDSLYFGAVAPGSSPALFVPGRISLQARRVAKLVFSPAGNECLIGVGESGALKTLYSRYDSASWTVPQPAPFINNARAQEPFFSPDGQKIFFTSYADIYECSRTDSGWSAPVKLGSPVNTAAEEYHPTVILDGTLYFCSMRDDPVGRLYRARYENGGYANVEKLDKIIPCPYSAFDPFIAPDESYIIFSSTYPDGYGKEDQYISYNRNGKWTYPKNLGTRINTSKIEYGSYVSADGKYYFFSRPEGWGANSPADIYWVSTAFIDSLRHTNFRPYQKNQISAQTIQTGTMFHFIIPDSTFYDDDGSNTLRYAALLSDGNPLPSWMVFEPVSCTLSGMPVKADTVNLTITATDTAGAKAGCAFQIIIVGNT